MVIFRKIAGFFISKTVVAGILGFLLSLLGSEIIFFIPPSKMLEFTFALIPLIVVLMLYVSGLLSQPRERYWKWRRFQKPIIIGILKGYFDKTETGIECEATYYKWVFDSQSFSYTPLYWSDISSKYAAIINPFGEIYLERDGRNFVTYDRIKEYVAEGGIFCSTGGFPFYYYWDPITGRRIDTTPKTRLIQAGFQDIRLFFDSLVTRDFDVRITNDPNSPTLTDTYQEKTPDIKYFGDLSSVGETTSVLEWRSLSEETKGIIAGLRVKHEKEIRYALAAVPYGNGYFIFTGMSVTTDVELKKMSTGIVNFITEIAKRHSK